MNPSRFAAAAALLASLALGGCVVAPLGAPVAAYPGAPYGELVPVPPPPPAVEPIGVAPVYGQIWIGGYWNWVGGRHVWIGGHWEAPRPGWGWVPYRWHRDGPGWRLNPGYWSRVR